MNLQCFGSHWIEANGQRKTLAEWSELTGIKTQTILARLYKGLSPDLVLSLP